MKRLKHICANINWSLKRLLVYVGGVACTVAFVIDAREIGATDYKVYLAYAGSLVILYSPQLAIHALEIYMGGKKDGK